MILQTATGKFHEGREGDEDEANSDAPRCVRSAR
jgi:hypothetical protein